MERNKNICDNPEYSKHWMIIARTHPDYILTRTASLLLCSLVCMNISIVPLNLQSQRKIWTNTREKTRYAQKTLKTSISHIANSSLLNIYGKHFNRKPWLQDLIEVKHWLLHVNNKQLQLKANLFNNQYLFA